MPRTATKSPKHAAGVRALARALKVAPSAVVKWTRDPRWPFGEAPWPIEEVRAWRARTLASFNGGGVALSAEHPLTKAKVAYLVEGIKRRKFDREVAERMYVLREEAERRMIELGLTFRQALFIRLRPIMQSSEAAREAIEAAWNSALDDSGEPRHEETPTYACGPSVTPEANAGVEAVASRASGNAMLAQTTPTKQGPAPRP